MSPKQASSNFLVDIRASPPTLPIALLGRRLLFGLIPAALGSPHILEPNKTAGAPTPVPTRKEQIGSAGASCNIKFAHLVTPEPLWQTHTTSSSRLVSHPARFYIATECRCPAPSSLPPPYNRPPAVK
jgi:hypothetical protein